MMPSRSIKCLRVGTLRLASHPNTRLENRHTLYLGESGSGKSQALKQNPAANGRGCGWVAWDAAADHKATRVDSLSDFRRLMVAGIKSGRGYRAAITPSIENRTAEYHEEWCRIVWAGLSGLRRLIVVDEEIASISSRPGKADRYHGLLLREGRKYGLEYHGTSQTPQEIPKTIYRECKKLWVGGSDPDAIEYVAKRIGVKPEEIAALKPLELFRYDRREQKPLIKKQFKYR